MLKNAGEEHTLRDSAGDISQNGLPAVLGIVANLGPVNRHEDDGKVVSELPDESLGEQRIVDCDRLFAAPREQSVT